MTVAQPEWGWRGHVSPQNWLAKIFTGAWYQSWYAKLRQPRSSNILSIAISSSKTNRPGPQLANQSSDVGRIPVSWRFREVVRSVARFRRPTVVYDVWRCDARTQFWSKLPLTFDTEVRSCVWTIMLPPSWNCAADGAMLINPVACFRMHKSRKLSYRTTVRLWSILFTSKFKSWTVTLHWSQPVVNSVWCRSEHTVQQGPFSSVSRKQASTV